jgi:hypothetical protein
MVRLEDLQEAVSYFTKFPVFSVMDSQLKEAGQFIQQMNADVLLNTPVDDIVLQVVSKYGFDVPVLSRDQAHLEEPREVRLTIQDYGRTIHPMGTVLTLIVPFSGDAGMFWVTPSQLNSGPPRGNLNNNTMVLRVKGTNLDHAQVTKTFNSTLDDFDMWLGWLRTNAQELEVNLKRNAMTSVEARRERLLADRNLVANLPFKIKTRVDSKQTYVAPVHRKPIQVQRPKTPEAFKPEPTLAEVDYHHILTVIEGMTQTMERNPTTFAKLDEEALRDMYLVPLNGHFEGAATGETFNAAGKTDILIRVEDRNIFIGECKIWRGPKYLNEAIEQLLSYLTWRDTKTAIIIFNRNKGLSAVLSSVQDTMNAHPQRKHGPKIEGETRFRYVFGNASDASREVIVTVLVFDVPT